MNKIVNRISEFFGTKDISSYPELYYKQERDLSIDIMKANSSVFHDSGLQPRYLKIRDL